MKKLTIRLTDELHAQLMTLAQHSQRSVNREVIWQVEQAVKREGLPTKLPTNAKSGEVSNDTPPQ